MRHLEVKMQNTYFLDCADSDRSKNSIETRPSTELRAYPEARQTRLRSAYKHVYIVKYNIEEFEKQIHEYWTSVPNQSGFTTQPLAA